MLRAMKRGSGRRIGLWLVLAGLLALVGGWLALRRPDIPYPELERRYGTAASHYVVLPDGVRMHYRDAGNPAGPVIVLVHGYSASAADWDGWAARLGGRYRLILPDLPGHGLTRAPAGFEIDDDAYVAELDALAAALKLPPFVLGGNSMGGGVAWRYVLAHPGRVRGLVLVDAAGWPEPPPRSPAKHDGALIFSLMANPLARPLLRDLDSTSFARQGLEAAFVDKALVTPALVRRYTDLARAPGHRDILLGPAKPRPRTPATAARLAAITVPTLVMVGDDDRLIPAEDGKRFADAMPNATLIRYPNIGHVPMEQIPQRSADDLKAWLGRHGLDR